MRALRTFAGVTGVALAAALGLACSQLGELVRPHTYPPSFEYIPDEKIDSAMWRMARDVKRVDELVHAPDGVDAVEREEIARLLANMQDATRQLGSSGARTNHPLIDAHREDFRRDLDAARRGVVTEPPSYTLTESLVAACARCHSHSTR